jgi:hypothetical protein
MILKLITLFCPTHGMILLERRQETDHLPAGPASDPGAFAGHQDHPRFFRSIPNHYPPHVTPSTRLAQKSIRLPGQRTGRQIFQIKCGGTCGTPHICETTQAAVIVIPWPDPVSTSNHSKTHPRAHETYYTHPCRCRDNCDICYVAIKRYIDIAR